MVACAFAAYEENVEIDPEKEHRERVLLVEYKQKLCIEGEVLTDPLDSSGSWIGEGRGMLCWPKIYMMDISKFYGEVLDKHGLVKCLECEYKIGKAYRYYSNAFVGEIKVNTENKKISVLKCVYRPKEFPASSMTFG